MALSLVSPVSAKTIYVSAACERTAATCSLSIWSVDPIVAKHSSYLPTFEGNRQIVDSTQLNFLSFFVLCVKLFDKVLDFHTMGCSHIVTIHSI